MGFKLDANSIQKLIGVHPDLVAVVTLASGLSEQPFMVLEGVRTPERQLQLYAQGRTTPGNVVTWTKVSNHFVNAKTGKGHAVDLVPFPVDWNTLPKFDAIAKAMFEAAKQLNIKLRWGADWNSNGTPRERKETDSPHFELGA